MSILRPIISRGAACLWLPLIISISISTALAQYRFDVWTADNGLPQNSVYDILQTRDGYLWLATVDGLVRFDGVRFTIFNKSDVAGIVSNRFLELFEDREGDLWAGTEDGGVTRYRQGRFITYGKEHGLTSLAVLRLTGDHEGGCGRRREGSSGAGLMAALCRSRPRCRPSEARRATGLIPGECPLTSTALGLPPYHNGCKWNKRNRCCLEKSGFFKENRRNLENWRIGSIDCHLR